VAGLAVYGELSFDVAGIVGGGEVRLVAGVVRRRHGLEFAAGATLVAGVAVDRSVSAGQRESVVMLLHILDRHLPSPHCVTLLAIGPQLTAVNIGVAVLAVLTDVGENHLLVTSGAGNRSVHSAQGITSPIVIEFRDGADWLPAVRSVAVLAGNRQIAVRTACAFGDLSSCASRQNGNGKSYHDSKFRCNPSAHELHPCFRSLTPKIRKTLAEDKLQIRLLQFAVQLE